MRYLVGEQTEVEYEARRLNLRRDQYRRIQATPDALTTLSGLKRITLEYVGSKPSSWFMEVANGMDIKVVKLDGTEERAILPMHKDESGKYVPDDIKFETVSYSHGGSTQIVAHLGDAHAIVPKAMLQKARDNVDALAVYIFPVLIAQLSRSSKDNQLPTGFIGMDFAGTYERCLTTGSALTMLSGVWVDELAENTNMRANLILAGDKTEAMQFATFMGLNNWVFLENTRMLMNYNGSTVYIVGGGRYRSDFGAIEGLFLMNNITQVDMDD